MDLTEFTKVNEISSTSYELDRYLEIGWRILAVKTKRSGYQSEPFFEDEVTFLIGFSERLHREFKEKEAKEEEYYEELEEAEKRGAENARAELIKKEDTPASGKKENLDEDVPF